MDHNSSQFKKLQKKWYAKIARVPGKQGDTFHDIEDSEEFLSDWHSLKFLDDQSVIRCQTNSDYQRKIEAILHHQSFGQILISITSHGNSASMGEAQRVWQLHIDGWTERRIAREIQRSKTCVHQMITRIREWMKIL